MSQDAVLFGSWYMKYTVKLKKNLFIVVPICDILLKHRNVEIKQN